MDVEAIADLATHLADSGKRLTARDRRTADLASTGGPTSLSTLLCPPMLVAAGWEVPKLGVAGRPAGGVDVLACIDGYSVSLDEGDVEGVLKACRYAHVDAGSTFAPADAELFAYRQSVGAQAVPDLAIASLLSKKLAMAVYRVGLEVRVAAHGNFGATFTEARAAASRFCDVGHALGLDPVCILTDASRPFQPYVGRGEALLALTLVLDGAEDNWLAAHLVDCSAMAAIVGGEAVAAVPRTEIANAVAANVIAQGGSIQALRRKAAEVARSHVHVVPAPATGHVEYDLGAVRSAVLRAQGTVSARWPDAAGLMLRVRPGELVTDGATLMTVRCPTTCWPALREALAAAVRIGHSEASQLSAILEVVGV
jgi:pyrimidine-nucleoside phosphorylase